MLVEGLTVQVQSVDIMSLLQQGCEPSYRSGLTCIYIVAISGKDPNWHFWAEFIQVNCYAYIALFCAVQSGNWHLRLGALKLMAPLFCAFDRPTYWRVIPQHLADCILLPTDTSSLFSEGVFSISITGRPWHSVGIDESHEMLINKDCKLAVVHPTKEFVSRVSLYFPFRSKVLHNLKKTASLNRSQW